ncbi:NEDD8 ultimate buster 1 [Scaptodrosophila lebanonensis]|uniref:NEDD8 ultimate buster 1 n=1 Tax=Drosophila lebanonensis TaxID=7225 RepID=A0A6J2TX33_DROLE|nr:NEDD8 ultimate buster 1 [Scaptodrosophila lebanonensis]
MSQMDNIFIQIRARLQQQGIRLWEEPYYSEGLGSIEAAMEQLATDYSIQLGIDVSHCRCVLAELQDNALRKLAARREFSETGLATFKVRRIDNRGGTTTMVDVKCDLNALGAALQLAIAQKLQLSNASHVKCISAGKIVAADATLSSQGLKNNQQLIVIVGQPGDNKNGTLYERINKIKTDVETVVDSQRQLVEMEDQDGNPVFLPPDENRALLIGMGFCEKARAAMHREDYDEALLLLLEADEKFATCNSKFLESVDNYALLNLDIVWCYLCLKNVSQLPDAERRLSICERSFRRSYGDNFARLYALKGKACPERALIMRLHLLQGVVLFHQNRRDEAYERLEIAAAALNELKVNDEHLVLLVEMGFDVCDARLALRSTSGDVERAVQFIQERQKKLNEARQDSKAEREVNRRYGHQAANDGNWVNPRSVCALTDMGFERQLVVEALRRTENDMSRAVDMLQNRPDELRNSLPVVPAADERQLRSLQKLGFDAKAARVALETTQNDIDLAIVFLLKAFESEEELRSTVDRMSRLIEEGLTGATGAATISDQPSTSSAASQQSQLFDSPRSRALIESVLHKAKAEMESYKAYNRFNADLTHSDQDYLDLPLVQEEQLLAEYRNLLEQ